MMMDWEEYRKQLIATIQQIGQASPDIVRGYRTIADGAAKRFAALQACRKEHPGADDPLFRPIDANDFRINGTEASDFSNLLEHGLVRVTLPLPAKGRGGRCPARAHCALCTTSQMRSQRETNCSTGSGPDRNSYGSPPEALRSTSSRPVPSLKSEAW
jgi:hypothetical protein